MPETEVQPNAYGRFAVPGKVQVELDLGSNKTSDYGVVQKDMPGGLPTAYDGVNINWFNAFGVRQRKADKSLGDYANILYTVTAPIPSGKRIFVYYANRIYEVKAQDGTGSLQNLRYRVVNGKTLIALTAGDPPIGYGP